jgi:hypothetical protein
MPASLRAVACRPTGQLPSDCLPMTLQQQEAAPAWREPARVTHAPA